MLVKILISSLLLISLRSTGQTVSMGGSIIIAAVVKDSIFMAADSRSSFYEDPGKTIQIGYMDSCPKIFKIKQFTVGIVGISALGRTFYHTIINAFNATKYKDTGLLNTMNKFNQFLDINYPIKKYPERKSNMLIAAGFVNLKPQMIGIDTSKTIVFNDGIIVSDTAVMKYMPLADNEKTIPQKLEKMIELFSKGEGKENRVGGPTCVVEIGANNDMVILQNNFIIHDYQTIDDLYEAVKKDQAKINYLVIDGKKRLLTRLIY